ncbi:glutathione S-transferase [Phanerochaete sordida]|uniref:glutathione transferase n=1 Tax=Phanerochaete sordida TaxID=48140 RepID=A0A9P3G014_9APHY|nr:glutathione S-transferase [Phanerochaete sordida]
MSSSETSTTLTVHHLNDSRSQRMLWLLEELEVSYNITKYHRLEDGSTPAELIAINPLGTAPVITDGDVTLAESGAIVEYILGKYGNGRFSPPEAGKIHNLFFTHYTEGTLMPLLVQRLIYGLVPQRSPFIVRPLLWYIFSTLDNLVVQPRLTRQATFIEEHLSKCGDWLAGGQGPTSADFMMSFALEAWVEGNPEMLGPKIKEYVKRIHARPAYQRALEKGGEYKYAKPAL